MTEKKVDLQNEGLILYTSFSQIIVGDEECLKHCW